MSDDPIAEPTDGFLRPGSVTDEVDPIESPESMRRLLQSAVVGIAIVAIDGRIRMLDAVAVELLGRSQETLIDSFWNDLPWSRFDPMGQFDPALRAGRSIRDSLARPQADPISLEIDSVPIRTSTGRVTGTILTMTDRRSRRHFEEALETSESNFAGIVGTIAEGIFLVDGSGIVTFANPSAEQLFGLGRGSIVGRHWTALPWYPASVPGEEVFQPELIEDWLLHQRDYLRDLVWIIPPSETVVRDRLVLVRFTPLDRPELADRGMVITFDDHTDRFRAREDVERSGSRFRAMIENNPDPILLLGPDGEVRYATPSLPEWPAPEIGSSVLPCIDGPDRERFRSRLLAVASAGVESADDCFEVRTPSRDGRREILEVHLYSRLHDPAVGAIVANLRIITNRREMARRMEESARMESVGRLAGGIAHDFNNLLTVLMGNLGLVNTIPQSSPDYSTLVEDCERAVSRAAELTRQLLDYARQTPVEHRRLPIGPIVEETLGLLRRTIERQIGLEVGVPTDLWPVRGDRSQIGQILMNLCLNSRDAMPEGGKLRISASNRSPTTRTDPMGVPAGEYVILEVSDDGSGIPEEVRSHIFEPFYTTKPVGRGVGLGLAVVSGLVRQHDGFIECVGGPNERGTTFRVWLPRAIG